MKVICNNIDRCGFKDCVHYKEHIPKMWNATEKFCNEEDGGNSSCFDGLRCRSKCGKPRKCVPDFISLVKKSIKESEDGTDMSNIL